MTSRRLLLISNSSMHGRPALEHCADAVRAHFDGVRRVLFVPWALADRDGYADTMGARFSALGLELESIHRLADPVAAVRAAEGIFVGGGNTFRLLTEFYGAGILNAVRERVAAGMPYMGSSAGTVIAAPTLKTTNDMPIVEPPSFNALGLIPFQINAHYLDPDPGSTHMGETRETRIREFHEMNAIPVLGLREGTWLRLAGGVLHLEGTLPARLFRQGAEPVEYETGSHLEFLLNI